VKVSDARWPRSIPKDCDHRRSTLPKNLLPVRRPPARRNHLVSPGDIISESAGDIVGSRRAVGLDAMARHGNAGGGTYRRHFRPPRPNLPPIQPAACCDQSPQRISRLFRHSETPTLDLSFASGGRAPSIVRQRYQETSIQPAFPVGLCSKRGPDLFYGRAAVTRREAARCGQHRRGQCFSCHIPHPRLPSATAGWNEARRPPGKNLLPLTSKRFGGQQGPHRQWEPGQRQSFFGRRNGRITGGCDRDNLRCPAQRRDAGAL
jgi:hypothetical protein